MTYNFKDGTTLEIKEMDMDSYLERQWRTLTSQQYKKIKELTELKGKKVLDFGCFHGLLTEKINEEASCVGIDINLPRKTKDTIKYDGKKIPFRDKSFDLVLMVEVLEHLEKIDEILEEIKRVLKNNGEIIITTPNKYYIGFKDDHNHWKNQIKQIINQKNKECVKMYGPYEIKRILVRHKLSCNFSGRFNRFPLIKRGFIIKSKIIEQNGKYT